MTLFQLCSLIPALLCYIALSWCAWKDYKTGKFGYVVASMWIGINTSLFIIGAIILPLIAFNV